MIEPSYGATHAAAQMSSSRVDVAKAVESYCHLVQRRTHERLHVPGINHFVELYTNMHLWEMA